MNRLSSTILVVLSLLSLLTVLVGGAQPPAPAPHDEGALARIYQLSVLALFPTTLVYVATADWRNPWRTLRPVAVALAVSVGAFLILYYLENIRGV